MLKKILFIWNLIACIFLLIFIPLNRIFSFGILPGDDMYKQAEISGLIFIPVSFVLRLLSRKRCNKDKN